MKRTGKMLPQALSSIVRQPATVAYPVESTAEFANIRGKLVFDPDKCVGCKLCTRDCPANAIEIEKVGDKRYKAVLSLDRCLFCGQCIESCNKAALAYTSNFELADLKRGNMKVDI